MKLLALDDPRWETYRSGYNRAELNTPAWIRKLMSGDFDESHWDFLWDELHHQGDVGEASYAVIPYLAQFAVKEEREDWHLFGFPAVVELARLDGRNPEIPHEVEGSYFEAFRVLSQSAVFLHKWDEILTPCASACIALAKGQPVYARMYLEIASKNRVLEILEEETGWTPE